MRIFSGVIFVGACICALATTMFPLYTQSGTTYMTYSDVWGTAYLVCVAAAILCLIIGRKGLMLGASLGAALLAGLKYVLLRLDVDTAQFANSHIEEYGNAASLLEKDPTVHHLNFVIGWNFYMFIGAAVAMFIFGFIYYCNAPSNDYR